MHRVSPLAHPRAWLALIAGGALLLTLLITTPPAPGQETLPRVLPKRITSTTTPARDRNAPFRYTTRGTLTPADLQCPANATSTYNCVPFRRVDACTGKVSVRFKQGTKTISTRRVNVNSQCRFTSRVTFQRSRFGTLPVRLKVSVRFLGNDVLLPRSASTKTVRAG